MTLHSYHDSVPEPRPARDRYERQAKRQEDRVLALFRKFPDGAFSREQIERLFSLPTQSASRVIANLTARYAIEKTGQTVTSSFGRRAHTWRLAKPRAMGEQGRLL